MLSVVPMVLEVAEEALKAQRHRLNGTHDPPGVVSDSSHRHREMSPLQTEQIPTREPLLLRLLLQVQCLVEYDISGSMKRDVVALLKLLSPS